VKAIQNTGNVGITNGGDGIGSGAMSERNLFDELERFFERMSEQFDQSGRSWGLDQWSQMASSGSVDLLDQGEEFVALIDLPGFEKDDIDVRIRDRTLHIDAERHSEIDEEPDEYIRKERSHESVSRRIELPDAVDMDAVDARLDDGILRLTIGKAEPTTSGESIEIE